MTVKQGLLMVTDFCLMCTPLLLTKTCEIHIQLKINKFFNNIQKTSCVLDKGDWLKGIFYVKQEFRLLQESCDCHDAILCMVLIPDILCKMCNS